MKIIARLTNGPGHHEVAVATDGKEQPITIAGKPDGGSAVNGGELLLAALATCYCNDVYREAKKRGIGVTSVRVEVDGEFGGEGEASRNVSYRAAVVADASADQIEALLRDTDRVAEIQNTLRAGVAVTFAGPLNGASAPARWR